MNNLILNTDSYKTSHYKQYPEGATKVFSYIESRGISDEYEPFFLPKTVFFGLQPFLKQLAKGITVEDVYEARDILEAHGVPFNLEGWLYIAINLKGKIPVEIKAVPEGTVVPVGNVLVSVVNTDDNVPWITSYIETALLRAVWYGTTVATNSWNIKQNIKAALEVSGDISGLPFKLHDFGARGVSSEESAAIGGAAHLINFMGTDTISGLIFAKEEYDAGIAGLSIPASEHSTITAWGREGEADAYRNMLKQFGGVDKIIAVVSDSYDLENAIKMWGTELYDDVLDSGTVLVVRPDSGDPTTVPVDAIEQLMSYFGENTNDKGYRVLPSNVRVIQGDGINIESINQIINNMLERKLSVDNIAFGMGGALLQQVNRDTFKFAMKASAIEINGAWRDVYKEPKTDTGKSSKRGRLALIKDKGEFKTVCEEILVDRHSTNELKTVFKEGDLYNIQNFAQVRELSESS